MTPQFKELMDAVPQLAAHSFMRTVLYYKTKQDWDTAKALCLILDIEIEGEGNVKFLNEPYYLTFADEVVYG